MMTLDGSPLATVKLAWLVDVMTPLLVTHRTVSPFAESATFSPVSPLAPVCGDLNEIRASRK